MANILYFQADGNLEALPGLGPSTSRCRALTSGPWAGPWWVSSKSWQYGVQTVVRYKGVGLTLAYTQTGPDSAAFNPWSSYPGYTSIMEEDNDRADDKTWMVGLSADFGMLGPGNLSGKTLFTMSDTPDTGQNASPDQWEADLDVSYRFKQTYLDGLWLRARGAVVNQDDVAGGQEYADFRFIINYEWNLLK